MSTLLHTHAKAEADASSRSGDEEKIVVSLSTLEQSFIQTEEASCAFTEAELIQLKECLALSATKYERHGYDIVECDAQKHSEISMHANGNAVITLQSRNLGSRFYLFNVANRRGLFGNLKKSVRVYSSDPASNKIAVLGTGSTMPKALALIDKHYMKIADAHLYQGQSV